MVPSAASTAKPLAPLEPAFERVRLAAKRMHIAGGRALLPGFPEQFGVGWIEAVEPCAFVSRKKWGDQMIAQPDIERVAPERRPVLFAENEQGSTRQIRRRMLASTRLESTASPECDCLCWPPAR